MGRKSSLSRLKQRKAYDKGRNKKTWSAQSFERFKINITKSNDGKLTCQPQNHVCLTIRREHSDNESNSLLKSRREHSDNESNSLLKSTFCKKFYDDISIGPVFTCIVCLRQLFRKSVTEFKRNNYRAHPEINAILLNTSFATFQSKNWICRTCNLALRKNKIPCQASINGLQLPDIPPELQDLTPLEERVISLRIPFMKLVALPAGQQKCIHGSAINVPTSLEPITSVLPRIPENCQVVPLKLKKKLSYAGHYQHNYIRPQKVITALRWLKNHNPIYRNIEILDNWEQQWHMNESELWQSFIFSERPNDSLEIRPSENESGLSSSVSNLHTSVPCADQIHQNLSIDKSCIANTDVVNSQSLHTTSQKSPTCPFSHCYLVGIDQYYQLLKNKADELNLVLHNVPGDGNCFFHSVSLVCYVFGLNVGSATHLRQRVIDYLEDDDLDLDWKGQYLPMYPTLGDELYSSCRSHANYLRSRNGKSFATEVCSTVLSRLLKIKLTIHKADVFQGNTRIQSLDQNNLGPFITQHQFHIGLKDETHYVAMLEPNHSCFQSSGNLELFSENNCNTSHIEISGDSLEGQLDCNDIEMLNDSEQHNTNTVDVIDHGIVNKRRGLLYDTCLQPDCPIDTSIYCIAPAENQNPLPFLGDSLYEEMANPTKFPFGTGGYSSSRSVSLPLKRYLNQRILHKDSRFAKDLDYIFAAQYAVEAKQIRDDINIFLRQKKGTTFQNQTINAGLIKNKTLCDELIRDDTAFRYMKNVRGSPAYWHGVLTDLLAMVRQLGKPTWFLTLSAADMHWPEVIKNIALSSGKIITDDDFASMSWSTRAEWLRQNPTMAAQIFRHRTDSFFKNVLCSELNPIGKVSDYMYRVEFQSRGSPHVHCIIWVDDAPKIDKDSDDKIIEFIDKYQVCSLPKQDEMRSLVEKLQKHVCTEACQKKDKRGTNDKLCRFNFPHLPSSQTMIARPSENRKNLLEKKDIRSRIFEVLREETTSEKITLQELLVKANVESDVYHDRLQNTSRGMSIVLKREPCECNINFYNSTLLGSWKANMDIQYILDYHACIMYITSYMTKSEGTMSELLSHAASDCDQSDARTKMKKVGATFINKREVSAQEAAFRLIPLELKRSTRAVVFVNTSHPKNRIGMLKSKAAISKLPDDSEDILCTSLLDRYIARPDSIEQMSYIEFAATYSTKYNSSDDNEIHMDVCNDGEILHNVEAHSSIDQWPLSIKLKNNLGVMKRRKRYIVVRFHNISEEKGEDYYRNMLMLYYPFRDESKDLNNSGDGSFFGKYQMVQDHVKKIEPLFSKDTTEFNNACDNRANCDIVEEWSFLGPNTAFLQAEQERHGHIVERAIHEEQSRNIDIEGEDLEENHTKALFTKEVDKTLLSNEEYNTMITSLNSKQHQFMEHHRHWLRKVSTALQNNSTIPQFNIFLSGPGGVGKSHIIKLVHHETSVLKQKSSNFQPNDIVVLLTAFTGTAAFEIDGMTIHSALGFTPNKDYVPLSSNKLNTIRMFLSKLLVLIIDEVSMVGSDFLYKIHRRLVEIKGVEAPFGGVSVLAVGDLFQLPPVCQGQVFDDPSIPLARLEGSMWKSQFSLFELTQSMRQKDDIGFSELLGRVRLGKCSKTDYDVLMSRNIEDTDHLANVLHVFSTNRAVDQHNHKMLKDKISSIFSFTSVDKAKDSESGLIKFNFSKCKQSETGNLRELLEVGVGARVMLTVNVDVSDGLVNGVCGTVVGFDNDSSANVKIIFVQFDNPCVGRRKRLSVFPGAVAIERKEVSFSVKYGKRVIGYRLQFPLNLAWACTIHKVQGKTMDKIVVSMKEGNFMAGQAYVAFSRVKKLQGLYLVGFTSKSIRVNDAAICEMERLSNGRSIQ